MAAKDLPRVICIVQARTGSSRLPGKVLKPLAGRPMLAHLIERLHMARLLDGLVIATTEHERDLPVAELAQQSGVDCFRGDENDVLSRYVGAAETAGADVVVRITSDCPLIDPETVDDVVRYFLEHEYDYIAAGEGSGFPRGLDTEVCTRLALLEAHRLGREKPDREHVTYFVHRHPEMFRLGYYQAPPELHHPEWRLCVDEEDDFRLIDLIYRRLYRPGEIINIRRVMELLENEPELVRINAHVRQKNV